MATGSWATRRRWRPAGGRPVADGDARQLQMATICDGSPGWRSPSATGQRAHGDHLRRVSDAARGKALQRSSGPRLGAMAHGTHDHADDPRNAEVLVWVNGDLVPRDRAVVSVFDSG